MLNKSILILALVFQEILLADASMNIRFGFPQVASVGLSYTYEDYAHIMMAPGYLSAEY